MDVDTSQAAVYIVGIWGGVVVPAAFAVYYSFISNWWENPTGRTLIALDICILLLRVDRLDYYFHHRSAAPLPTDWLVAIVNVAIPLIILYRAAMFEKKRQLMKRQARKSAETLRLIFTGLVP